MQILGVEGIMVSNPYFDNRKKWLRPQALIFSNNSNGILDGYPQINGTEGLDFIILSDHNRSEIAMSTSRIENRKRMANAHMRSYHLADKMVLSTSWSDLPSRSFSEKQQFSSSGRPSVPLTEYTTDSGAGGAEILEWYENNKGSFYVFLSYDKPHSFEEDKYEKLSKYSEVLEFYFSSFNYDIVKRGGQNHDLWNVSLTLEEV
jgi:hypothetical protein